MSRALVYLVVSIFASVQAQDYSSEELAPRTIELRAVEAIIWGIPVVNYDLMLQRMLTKTSDRVRSL